MTPARMKKDFIRKLNYLQACGINAIIFQVRPEADAFYKSDIEPWSRFFTGEQGVAPAGEFDPMAFLIQECHKRNMEFHAWLNPYRASTAGNTRFADSHIYHKHPEWFVTYNKQILFDPGLPESRQFICRVVRDIVGRYDVDAIHMDDYFYPYPAAGMPFPDDNSFRKYGLRKGYSEAQRNDWRRENVNTLIRELKRTILLTKLGYASVSVPSASTATRKAPQTDRVAIPTVCKTTTTSTPISPIGYSKVGSIITSPDLLGDRTPGSRLHHAYQMVGQKRQRRSFIYRARRGPHHESGPINPQDALRACLASRERQLFLARQ